MVSVFISISRGIGNIILPKKGENKMTKVQKDLIDKVSVLYRETLKERDSVDDGISSLSRELSSNHETMAYDQYIYKAKLVESLKKEYVAISQKLIGISLAREIVLNYKDGK
jgi:hypothetical protein